MGPSRIGQVCKQVLVAALAVIAGPACQDEVHPLDIHLDFVASSGDSPYPCPSSSCGDIPMSCQGQLSIRVVDPEDERRVIEGKCVPVPVTDTPTLCALGNIQIPLQELPLGPARIEIALWDAAQLPDGQCPDQPIFDLHGHPISTVVPQPVVAGAAYFDIGSAPDVQVPLSCFDTGRLQRAECLPPVPPTLVVQLRDLEGDRLLEQDDEVDGLVVEHVSPQIIDNDEWVITRSDTQELASSVRGDIIRWQGTLTAPLQDGDELCVQVRHRGATDDIPVVSCFHVEDLAENPDAPGELPLEALYLPREQILALLKARGLDALPSTGLLVGRVTSSAQEDVPVAGLLAAPTPLPVPNPIDDPPEVPGEDPGQAPGQEPNQAADPYDVAYLSEDRTTTDGVTRTTSNGYFLATSAPYPSAWAAAEPDGPVRGESPYRGGLIQDVLNAVRIAIEPPP